MKTYNLTTKPWIPVVMVDGSRQEVSLLDALRNAPRISGIAANPLETAVLYRLLFAVAHRVATPRDPQEWLKAWEDREGLLCNMGTYLEKFADKFDLYSEDRPFLQHPGLPSANRTPAEIVYDRARGNNPIFLDGSIVSMPEPISSAEAARALMVTHAYGGSGTGGLNPLNGSKKDTMYAGPLCARMIVVLEGNNLGETVLLNLIEGKKPGLPAWERPLCNAPCQTRPAGVCDLYTRPTRNARLSASEDGTWCSGVSVVMGEGILSEESIRDDPLIPVYFAKTDKKFKALRVNPAKALWRNSHVLLVPDATDASNPLPAIALIRGLVTDGEFEHRSAIRLRALGVAANAQGPVTDMWLDEALSFSLDLFSESGSYQALASSIELADSEANSLRRKLTGFAARYVSDGAGNPDPKDVARLVDEIAPGLNDYWMEIAPQGERLAMDPPDAARWAESLKAAQRLAFKAAIDRLAPDARRMRAEHSTTGHIDASNNAKERRTA